MQWRPSGTRGARWVRRSVGMLIGFHLGLVAMPPDLAMNEPLAINALTLASPGIPAKILALDIVLVDAPSVPAWSPVTLRVGLQATYKNPCDSKQIRVDAEVTPLNTATQTPWMVPGFLYQPFTRRLKTDGKTAQEQLETAGAPEWQIRFSIPTPGPHRITVRATDAGGRVEAPPFPLNVTQAAAGGMVRIHPTDSRFFATDDGEFFFPVGANVCWGGARGTFSYDEWLPAYAENGCNFFRVWLSPLWTTFAMNTSDSGYDTIDLANAWRLDHVLETAESLGLRVMLCIDSFNILRENRRTYGRMLESPYHVNQGGPVEKSADYFTHPRMLDTFRDRLRYLVARYGYSTSVFAWEFWNEVDIIDQYDSALATSWHRDMARYLRQLDPWNHLITTSTARPRGDPQLDALPEMEFVQTHHYQAKDMASALHRDATHKKAAQDRPHFHGEFGISHSGEKTAELDPRGIHLHNALFASAVQLQAGTPMTWWWDSYVYPKGLYPIFRTFTRWIASFDFAEQEVQAAKVTVVASNPADMANKTPPNASLIRAYAAVGKTRGLLWCQHRQATWSAVHKAGRFPDAVTGVQVDIRDVPAGRWNVTWINTKTGEEAPPAVALNTDRKGSLTVPLPPIHWDAAARLTKME